MAQLNPYLTFNGNCRQAMEFYQASLGGELSIMAVKDSPMKDQIPAEAQNAVMHSLLRSDSIILMASDQMTPGALVNGNTITLCVIGRSKAELEPFFTKLSDGGNVSQPLQETFFGAYGALTDKFGINWMFQADKA
jgi:PhnB protein